MLCSKSRSGPKSGNGASHAGGGGQVGAPPWPPLPTVAVLDASVAVDQRWREAFEAVSNGDPGAPLGREVEIASLLAFIRDRRIPILINAA